MHGMMYEFPQTFHPGKTAGIRPLCSHLRYIPDIAGWNDRVILAADDTSIMQNPLAGQRNRTCSSSIRRATKLWPAHRLGFGVVGRSCESEHAERAVLVRGFEERTVHLSHKEREPVTFTLEIDRQGTATGKANDDSPSPPPRTNIVFCRSIAPGEWIRVTADKDCHATVKFDYRSANKNDGEKSARDFASVPEFKEGAKAPGIKIWPAKAYRGLEGVATMNGKQQLFLVNEDLKFSSIQEGVNTAADLDKSWRLPGLPGRCFLGDR